MFKMRAIISSKPLLLVDGLSPTHSIAAADIAQRGIDAAGRNLYRGMPTNHSTHLPRHHRAGGGLDDSTAPLDGLGGGGGVDAPLLAGGRTAHAKTNGVTGTGRRLPNLAQLYGRAAGGTAALTLGHTSSTESQQPLNPSYDSRDDYSMDPQRADALAARRRYTFANRS